MPSENEILKKKLKRLETIPADFVNTIPASERKIYNDLVEALKKLQLDSNGNVILNAENYSLIEVLGNDFEAAVQSSGYYDNLTDFIKEFNTQKSLNKAYYSKAVEGFENKDVFDLTYEQSKKTAVDILAESSVKENLAIFKDNLNNAISNGSNILDVQQIISESTVGTTGSNAKLGMLNRYAKQEANDLFAIADRNYTTTVAKEFGIEFYYYAGGEMDTTRCFCDQRVGKTFHKKEIELWGEGKTTAGGLSSCGNPWQGMAAGTSKDTIFSLLGGYNCQHSLVPRGISETPIDVIERAISEGYVNLEDLPEDIQNKLK
jgi:hypothetical protein